MLLKQSQFVMGWALFASTVMGGICLSPAQAQMSEQEFQMGRAREACTNQAQKQLLTVNRVVSTTPIGGSGGRMIGSEVLLSVSRKGATYDVKCRYDNASRAATISSLSTQPDRPAPPTSRPVPPTNALVRSCWATLRNQINRKFAGVQKLNFLSDTTRAYFVSNAEEGVQGDGQFYQPSGTWYRFSYDCIVNKRNGRVVRATYQQK